MKRVEKLPSAFKRYRKMGGVLDFEVFEDSTGAEEDILSSISQTLRRSRTFDADQLRRLGCKCIKEQAFYGDWYDVDTGHLLKVGAWRTADGRELQNPELKKLDRVKIIGGGSYAPEAGAGGQFAYAFSCPPYGLRARPSEVQAVFDTIKDVVLPPDQRSEICDWSSPQLPEVSDYFAAGMEGWGVFLFSIYTPEIKRLAIVSGSATD